MGTLSRLALILFLVVGLLASAERPGTINIDPFAAVRATPLPSGNNSQMTDAERQKWQDMRSDYYRKDDTTTNWQGQPVMQAGGAAERYQQCRAACVSQIPPSAKCAQTCDAEYMRSQATNTQQLYENTGQAGGNGSFTNPTNRQPAGLQQTDTMPGAAQEIRLKRDRQ